MPSLYYTPTPPPLFSASADSFVNNISVDRTAVPLDPIADVTVDAPVGLIRQAKKKLQTKINWRKKNMIYEIRKN